MHPERVKSQSDAELLATLLRCREPSPDGGRPLAERLLERFGGLRALLHADGQAVRRLRGVGPARATVIAVLPELARRYFEAALVVGEPIRSPADTTAFLLARLRHLDHELFCCLFLDNRHRVLEFSELFRGTIDGTSVYPREVVKGALRVNAAAVILAHNQRLERNNLFFLVILKVHFG